MLSIDLLISTMNYTPGALDVVLENVPDFVNVIVVNQKTNGREFEPVVTIRPNVTCYSYRETGLSKSRNRLISLAVGDVVIISDDDVQFLAGAFEKVREIFDHSPDTDIITFKMLRPDGKERKPYKNYSFEHNIFSIFKVSSCEVVIRRERLVAANIWFDESFGLGTDYPLGEEVVFLKDCLKAGMNVSFFPEAISSHPIESTGNVFTEISETARGAMFYRIYGQMSYLLGFLFYFRKRHILKIGIGGRTALQVYFRGISEYKKN